MAAVAACIPFAFAALAFRKARAHNGAIPGLVEAAWMAAATDIARSRGGVIDAATFAKVTRASEGAAGEILARMASQNVLSSSENVNGTPQYKLPGSADDAPRLAGGN
jgi:hypothetical protein